MSLLPHHDFLSKQTDGVIRAVENLRAAAGSCRQSMHDAIARGDIGAAADAADRLSFISSNIEFYARGTRGAEVRAHLKSMGRPA